MQFGIDSISKMADRIYSITSGILSSVKIKGAIGSMTMRCGLTLFTNSIMRSTMFFAFNLLPSESVFELKYEVISIMLRDPSSR